ncbi:MAG: 50S ribosomal protein L5 [Leptospirillum sp.]|jgi:large subunit ribosomal protein L5
MEDKKKPSAKAAGSAGSSKKKNAGKSDAEVVEKKKVTRTSVSTSESNVPRLRKKYDSEISKELVSTLNLKNVMEAPKLKKITINIALGEAVANPKVLDTAVKELESITGQKAVKTKAKKSIAGFKLREGMPIGTMVTLRGNIMWEFLDRFVSIALPRIRDFKGLNDKSFDGRGNFTTGLKEQIIFPEIKYDEVSMFHGMDICFTTTAKTDVEGRTLLKLLGIPFKK